MRAMLLGDDSPPPRHCKSTMCTPLFNQPCISPPSILDLITAMNSKPKRGGKGGGRGGGRGGAGGAKGADSGRGGGGGNAGRGAGGGRPTDSAVIQKLAERVSSGATSGVAAGGAGEGVGRGRRDLLKGVDVAGLDEIAIAEKDWQIIFRYICSTPL